MSTGWAQREITPEMMQRAYRVIQFVVVEECQFIMDLGASWAVIECGFVKIDRAVEVSLRRFHIGVLHQLGVARSRHPITASETTGEEGEQPNASQTPFSRQRAAQSRGGKPELVSARHRRQFACL